MKKLKTKDKTVKWSNLVTEALKSAGEELELDTLVDQVLQQVRDQHLSRKSDTKLKKKVRSAIRESDKLALVQVVRLKARA